MSTDDQKQHLLRYLLVGRDALVWKLEGLDEHDARRPLVPTGTNVLGVMKHVAITTGGYFAGVFDRPMPEIDGWFDHHGDFDDMWVPADESRADVLGLWDRSWAHAVETIEALPLDAPGHVPWWRPAKRDVTLHQILVHAVAEVHRHAGHVDLVRELIDGAAGLRADSSNLPDGMDWPAHVARIQAAADAHRSPTGQ